MGKTMYILRQPPEFVISPEFLWESYPELATSNDKWPQINNCR